ncbi:MAG: DUF4253 domain-containing protein [Acidobacteria bacterium]|nr:DUF4253 domain-containing protein [Acidobacteriota bacterium]
MVPAYLKLGNWNLSPAPEVHVALCKKWSDQYGAVLISASADILEFEVARPPQTQEAAKQLALEQYFYCPDIVEQGVGTVGQLAVERVDAKYWFFWWD